MPRARSRSSLIALDASTRALRTSSAASGCSSRRSSARPELHARARPGGPARRRAGRARSGAARRPGRPARRGGCGSARRRARSAPSRARDAARATSSSSARAGRAPRTIPNSGQNSQKPNPVTAQMNVRMPPATQRQRGVDVQRAPLARTLARPSDRVLQRDRDRSARTRPRSARNNPEPGREPRSRPSGRRSEPEKLSCIVCTMRQSISLRGSSIVMFILHESQPSRPAPFLAGARWRPILGLSPPRLPSSADACPRAAPRKDSPVEQRPGEAVIWTDGACSGNPGPGGWAAIVIPADGGDPVELSGGERRRPTTGWS